MLGRLAYHTLAVTGVALAAPFFVSRLGSSRQREIMAARLGLGRAWLPVPGGPGALWVHALSVGEVGTALPLVRALGKRFPGRPLVLSTATAGGLELARQGLDQDSAVALLVRPLDLPWAVPKVLDRLRPALSVLVEGDIWPGWQWGLGARGVPRLLVNGRVSPRTFAGYQRLGPLARELLGGFERILVQSQVDYQRMAAVGVAPARLAVGGNLKFDTAPPALGPEEREALARELGLAARPVLVAGSTHAGEEEPCLAAFQALAAEHPGLALLLAPREVSRAAGILELARSRGLRVAALSQGAPPPDTQVVVLDLLGLLARAYAVGRAAFVGGSFTTVGGHNLLEPAAQGVPVFFGPHTHNFLAMARGLEEAGGGFRLAQGGELLAAWGRALAEPAWAAAAGQTARDFTAAHRGALDRAVEEAAGLLEVSAHGA
ncbi:MAG: 3-deoxy-D-manno-octulosonic acid transferase [Deltaproteobacteria bacterium]|nr:3-deoxy-D-manno-octulosonic acid transferase [Deltaproteobacteria bacterium]